MIPKGSPYATRIHNLLGKMSEAGLVKKWDENTSYNLQLEALRESTADLQDNRDIKVFTLVDLRLSFFVWGLGVTLCVVVFVLEISFGRTIRK
jgi:DNA-binding IclR family transcriptional regulator